MNTHRIIKSVAFFAVMLLMVSSCQLPKKYTSPETDVANLFRDTLSGDTLSIANLAWADYFKDENLQTLIKDGLVNNNDMLVALSRIKTAEISLDMAKAANLPTLSVAGQISHTRTSSGKNGTDVLGYTNNVNQLGFSATWEMNLWGKINSQKRAKYASMLNSKMYASLVQTNIVSNVARLYYSLLALDEQLRITKETIGLLKQNAETMQALKEAGKQNAAAVEQSNALLYKTQISIPDLENAIRQNENAICLLLGRNPGKISRKALSDQSIPAKLDYGVPMQLLARRPDVQQAELTFRTYFEMTNVANANLYPTITITPLSLGLASGYFSDLFKPQSIAANLVAGISQPLFRRKELKGNLKIAQLQQDEAMLNFKNTVLTAGQEVSNILYGYQASLSKNDLRNKQIKSLDNAVVYTQELLKAGVANYTEVLTAEQSLLAAKLGQVDDKLEQLKYNVNLYKALGGGVK
jgi:outer membrane protein, multidrug efflux system